MNKYEVRFNGRTLAEAIQYYGTFYAGCFCIGMGLGFLVRFIKEV